MNKQINKSINQSINKGVTKNPYEIAPLPTDSEEIMEMSDMQERIYESQARM
jgi:hypothetical protein